MPTSASPAEVTIRRAREDDMSRVNEIYNHYVAHTPITFDLEPSSLEARRAWFRQFAENGPHQLFVADRDGSVVGYVGTHQFRGKRAYDTTVETTIYCAPDCTGLGIGRALYDELFASVAGADVRLAIAGITLPNDASVALHERFGFSLVGVMHEVGRKFDRYWDVAFYEKRLD